MTGWPPITPISRFGTSQQQTGCDEVEQAFVITFLDPHGHAPCGSLHS